MRLGALGSIVMVIQRFSRKRGYAGNRAWVRRREINRSEITITKPIACCAHRTKSRPAKNRSRQ